MVSDPDYADNAIDGLRGDPEGRPLGVVRGGARDDGDAAPYTMGKQVSFDYFCTIAHGFLVAVRSPR